MPNGNSKKKIAHTNKRDKTIFCVRVQHMITVNSECTDMNFIYERIYLAAFFSQLRKKSRPLNNECQEVGPAKKQALGCYVNWLLKHLNIGATWPFRNTKTTVREERARPLP